MFKKDREIIPQYIREQLPAGDAFAHIMDLRGEVFRDMPGRLTLNFKLGGQSYFVKQHFGVGWKEIFKNFLSLKLPIVGARTEKLAIEKLNAIGIPTTPLVAFGERGCNPATQQSFVVTKDLGDITSLETLCADWKNNPPTARFKRRLIVVVAKIAQKLHDGGMNHRDFYICHFCLDNVALKHDEIKLYLIDLHRVGIAQRVSVSARMKDIAGLYFSAMDIGLTKRDYLRFLSVYRKQPLVKTLNNESGFWHKVSLRADELYKKFQRKYAVRDVQ